MPTYAYRCEKCYVIFDRYLDMSKRDQPLSESCEKCGCKSIVRDFTSFSQPIATDMNCTPDKKTNGQWGQLMGKIKKGIPKRYHKNLDNASSHSGRKWN
jgi:putative FmdB family regulatory protein